MKEVKIERLYHDHPARVHGFNFSASIYVNNTYCGNGKFFKTMKEAEVYKIKEGRAQIYEEKIHSHCG